MSGEVKDNLVAFPLGSSLNAEAADVQTINTAFREGLTEMIIIGLNEDGCIVAVSNPDMTNERMHYLLAKATALVASIEDGEEEEDVEED